MVAREKLYETETVHSIVCGEVTTWKRTHLREVNLVGVAKWMD
jgi:hypothetical protein